MSSDAISTQPRKGRCKAWMIGLAVVMSVAAIALLANSPKQEPVKVWFVRTTNELGEKKLVFEGTNGATREFEFFAGVFTGATPRATTLASLGPHYDWVDTTAEAGTSFALTLQAPSNDVPYYVMWGFYHLPVHQSRWTRLKWGCYDFLAAHGMPRLAEHLVPPAHVHYIPSSEIRE